MTNTPESSQIRGFTEEVTYNGELFGVIIYSDFKKPGIHFFTPNNLSQQLAHMQHPAGKVIQPHVHNPMPRQVFYTQEVLVIKQGKLRIDFYTKEQEYLKSFVLQAGDVILLIQGGHGFEVLEDLEMIEVKQGPYVGDQDKTRFSPLPKRIDRRTGKVITSLLLHYFGMLCNLPWLNLTWLKSVEWFLEDTLVVYVSVDRSDLIKNSQALMHHDRLYSS